MCFQACTINALNPTKADDAPLAAFALPPLPGGSPPEITLGVCLHLLQRGEILQQPNLHLRCAHPSLRVSVPATIR